MGRPGKPAHIRRPHRLAIAAAPTLFGLAAALSLSAQAAPAGAATAPATAHHAVAAVHTDSSSARLMSVARNAAAHEAHLAHVAHVAHVAKSALPTRYTVRSGDSLAAISQRFYRNPDAWPVLYWANHHQIHWANEIEIGQVLNVPVKPARTPQSACASGPPRPPPTRRCEPARRAYRPRPCRLRRCSLTCRHRLRRSRPRPCRLPRRPLPRPPIPVAARSSRA